ncbi:unnamed protein product, partial [Brassica oleracea var. botrytis]
ILGFLWRTRIHKTILYWCLRWSENMLYESWENNHAISFVLMKVWYSPAIELLDRSLVFPDTVEIDSTSEVEHSRFLRLKVCSGDLGSGETVLTLGKR